MSAEVAIAMPWNGSANLRAARAFYGLASRKHRLCDLELECSILTSSFNSLWCAALTLHEKAGTRYFCMLHSDVCPEPWWVDTLMQEIQDRKVDVVSAVVPIRGPTGLTSTAIGDADQWAPRRRLTMHEVAELPQTFECRDASKRGILLVNTGCWIADLSAGWCDKIVFRNQERNVKNRDGVWVNEIVPEDWTFSYDLHRMKAKVLATTKVALHHERKEWHNQGAWGTLSTDIDYNS